VVALGSATSFRCTFCTCSFTPSGGGHCGRCGKLFCSTHLPHICSKPAPNRSTMLCEACHVAILGGQQEEQPGAVLSNNSPSST
jgi:hypothetical protein